MNELKTEKVILNLPQICSVTQDFYIIRYIKFLMKKGVILLLTILSSLELVNAQTEITLFGQSYSIILL